MSYLYSIDSLKTKAFLIQSVLFSSEDQAKHYLFSDGVIDSEERIKLTKKIVSEYIIEIAARIRLIQDDFKHKKINIKYKEKEIGALDIGNKANGIPFEKNHEKDYKKYQEENNSLRYFANKILHADSFNLSLKKQRTTKPSPKIFWASRLVQVTGSYGKNEWQIGFDLISWLDNVIMYLNLAQEHFKKNVNLSSDLFYAKYKI